MTKAILEPAGFHRRIPLAPHQLTARTTPTQDVILLCHLGVPRVPADSWEFGIGGLVRTPLRLRLSDLTSRPKATIETIHQCAGSPLDPETPTRRICNVQWGGVRLADLLTDCGMLPDARYVWATGMDHGTFNGVACASYVKDLPIERVNEDVLIAYELNGEPLPPEHGYPARLVVPGFYGTNSVKWLTRIDLADRRAAGPFTTRWYNDVIKDAAGRATGQTTPVWSIAPESVIVSPATGEQVDRHRPVEVWGWAWADGGVAAVDLSFDDGSGWIQAELEPTKGRVWQRFSLAWLPDRSGDVAVRSRARDHNGATQPLDGARNAIHAVSLVID